MPQRHSPVVIAGLASLACGHAAPAQDSTVPGAVDADGRLTVGRVSEELRQSPQQVSGVRVLGYAAPPVARGLPEFSVRMPPDWPGGTVCLRVQTADALYEAAAEIGVPSGRAGQLVPLGYDSRYQAQFWQERAGGLGDEGLAALVSEGSCDARPGEAPVLPVLGGAAAPVLLLNTFRAETGFTQIGDATDTGSCAPIAAPVRTAFDMRCELHLPAGVPGATAGAVLVTVWPVKDGELGLPIEVSVWLFP